jgi:hypothetical protein
MTVYAIFNPDGAIVQCNKVFIGEEGEKKYEQQLKDLGQVFVSGKSDGVLPPEHFYVDTKAMQLSERPRLSILVDKQRIKAGNGELATFSGVPKGCNCNIYTMNTLIYAGKMEDTTLSIAIPVPCIYRVVFSVWPFKDSITNVEAA